MRRGEDRDRLIGEGKRERESIHTCAIEESKRQWSMRAGAL